MSNILTKFRRESQIDSSSIPDVVLINELMADALARYNHIMDTEIEIDIEEITENDTEPDDPITGDNYIQTNSKWAILWLPYSAGNDSIDLAICYLTISGAYKSERMRRIVQNADTWYMYEQMAYGIMCEIDPSKIGRRPSGAGGEYYIRWENRGIPYNKLYVQCDSTEV